VQRWKSFVGSNVTWPPDMCRQHQSLSRNACLSTISRSYFSVDEDRQKVQPSIRLRAYQDLPNPFRCATVNPRTPTSGNSREHETDEQVRNVNNKSHFDPLYRFLIRSGSRSRRSCPKSRVSKITRHQLMNSTTHESGFKFDPHQNFKHICLKLSFSCHPRVDDEIYT
jgi:hypothetical protein